jgi:hypothetical protein
MTKNQIIETMQLEEAAAYLKYQRRISELGHRADLTIAAQNQWLGIYRIMKACSIETNIDLPDAKAAQAIVIPRLQLEYGTSTETTSIDPL